MVKPAGGAFVPAGSARQPKVQWERWCPINVLGLITAFCFLKAALCLIPATHWGQLVEPRFFSAVY